MNIDQVLHQGLMHHQAGRLRQAASVYESVLAQTPRHAEALHLSGLAALQMGQLQTAVQRLSQAVSIDKKDWRYHNHLGEALRAIGDNKSAVKSFRKALKLEPKRGDVHANMGNAFLALGQYLDAEKSYKRAVQFDPDNPIPHYNLGNAYRNQGKAEDAMVCYRGALEIRSDFIEARNNLGLVLQSLGRTEEAKAEFQAALDVNPEFSGAVNNLSRLLLNQHDFKPGIALLEQALEADNPPVELYGNLCYALVMDRQWDKAQKWIEQGLAAAPKAVLTHVAQARILSEQKQFQEAAQHLQGIDPSEASPLEQKLYHYELGKLLDRCEDAKGAFHHLSEANRLAQDEAQRKGIDKEQYNARLQTLMETTFEGATWSAGEEEVESPVFLVGFPRSGTTLLDQVIDAHPAFSTLEEKPCLSNIVKAVNKMEGGYPAALETMDAAQINGLREEYWASVRAELDLQDGETLVDKFPLSIIHMPLIYKLFPKAKIILAIRHPCDACFSCFMQNFLVNAAMANYFSLDDAADFYAQVFALWEKYTKELPVDAHIVRYEDLVKDLETEARALLNFLGQPWDEAVLSFYEHAKTRKAISTPSRQQVDKPIYSDAVYRWQRYGDVMEGAVKVLDPYIRKFGYAD